MPTINIIDTDSSLSSLSDSGEENSNEQQESDDDGHDSDETDEEMLKKLGDSSEGLKWWRF